MTADIYDFDKGLRILRGPAAFAAAKRRLAPPVKRLGQGPTDFTTPPGGTPVAMRMAA